MVCPRKPPDPQLSRVHDSHRREVRGSCRLVYCRDVLFSGRRLNEASALSNRPRPRHNRHI